MNYGPARILIVDDHREMAAGLAEFLRDDGYDAEIATSGEEALRRLREAAFDAVISDLKMKSMDGLRLMKAIHAVDEALPVFLMTAFGSIENAVEAVKEGAYHYFSKPLKTEEVRIFLERALAHRALQRSSRELLRDSVDRYSFESLVGRSEAMRAIFDLVDRVADGSAAVLITGESGVGKELVARAIHFRGARRDKPFVPLNCAAIPTTLLESEIFGHEKGAFTGAGKARLGLAAEAAGGTLFLDEIGDLDLTVQPKLLRLLQDGEVRPVGANTTRIVDVRLIAATNIELQQRVIDERFRRDLYYRLNVVPIHVPPLRERREDIPILAEKLMQRVAAANPHLHISGFSRESIELFVDYPWPGNVRELGNVIERAATLCQRGTIAPEHIAFLSEPPPRLLPTRLDEEMPTLLEMEARYIDHVLQATGNNKVKAAAILGVDPSTLYRRLKRR